MAAGEPPAVTATAAVVQVSVALEVGNRPLSLARAGPGQWSHTYTGGSTGADAGFWHALTTPSDYGTAANVTTPTSLKVARTAGLIGLGFVTGGAGTAVAGALGLGEAAGVVIGGGLYSAIDNATEQLGSNQPFSGTQLVVSTAAGAALGGALHVGLGSLGLGAAANEAAGAAEGTVADEGAATARQTVECGTNDGCFVAATQVLTAGRGREPIGRVAAGRRVVTGPGDEMSDGGPALDPADYRLVTLLHVKPGTGQRVTLDLLRHASKVEHLGPGDTVRLTVVELEADGSATVLSVGPAPAIEAGRGRLVTGTIRTDFADVRHVKLVGLDGPIGVTAAHALFSEDAGDFVPVADLGRGERLRTRSGVAAVVESVTPAGSAEVFNLEVGEVHRYYASDRDVLAHNAGPCPGTSSLVEGGPHSETKLPVGDGLDSHHIPPRSVSGLNSEVSPAVKIDPLDHILTSSNGRGGQLAAAYRQMLADLIAAGQIRQVFAIEIRDLRSIVGNDLNSGIKQMLRYAKGIGYLPPRL